MRIPDNTMITIEEERYLVLGRVKYMAEDYYAACEVDADGYVLEDKKHVLCFIDECDVFDMEVFKMSGRMEDNMSLLEDKRLAALILDIFEAQKSFIE